MPREPEENLYEVEELLNQPGTYFNPQTEVVVIVDDSASIDQEVFDTDAYAGAEWVRVSDDVPVDEDGRDRALEAFETGHSGSASRTALGDGDDEPDEEDDENGPDSDPDPEEDED